MGVVSSLDLTFILFLLGKSSEFSSLIFSLILNVAGLFTELSKTFLYFIVGSVCSLRRFGEPLNKSSWLLLLADGLLNLISLRTVPSSSTIVLVMWTVPSWPVFVSTLHFLARSSELELWNQKYFDECESEVSFTILTVAVVALWVGESNPDFWNMGVNLNTFGSLWKGELKNLLWRLEWFWKKFSNGSLLLNLGFWRKWLKLSKLPKKDLNKSNGSLGWKKLELW